MIEQYCDWFSFLLRLSHGGRQYILKNILPGDMEYILSLQKLVDGSAHIRTLVDSIPDRHIFVYPYLETNLLDVSVKDISPAVKRSALKDALSGLADLHDKGIYHTGRFIIALRNLVIHVDVVYRYQA
jgi:hypothetical protein